MPEKKECTLRPNENSTLLDELIRLCTHYGAAQVEFMLKVAGIKLAPEPNTPVDQ